MCCIVLRVVCNTRRNCIKRIQWNTYLFYETKISLKNSKVEQVSEGKWSACCSAIARIELKDGAYCEDIGFGAGEGVSNILALECAKKVYVLNNSFN